jgi:hypothetical protein
MELEDYLNAITKLEPKTTELISLSFKERRGNGVFQVV